MIPLFLKKKLPILVSKAERRGKERNRMFFSAATPMYPFLQCLSDHALRLPHFISVTVTEYIETEKDI